MASLCSAMRVRICSCTDCTTSKRHSVSSESDIAAPKASFCAGADMTGGVLNTASISS